MSDRILLVTPTYAAKAYCLDEHMRALEKLVVPDGCSLTILDLVNGTDPFDRVYFDAVLSSGSRFGTAFWASHIVFDQHVPLDFRIATLYNICRQVVLDRFFDYMFIVEADVVLNSADLSKLLADRLPIVSGVTTYADADSPAAGDSGVMVFKEMPEEREVAAPPSMTLDVLAGNGSSFMVPMSFDFLRVIRSFPYHRPYTLKEAGARSGVHREKSVSFGCMLIRRDVLKAVRFRCGSLSTVFPDFLFCSDLHKAGYHVWVDWDVRPAHRPHEWFKEGIKVGQRRDVVSSGRLW